MFSKDSFQVVTTLKVLSHEKRTAPRAKIEQPRVTANIYTERGETNQYIYIFLFLHNKLKSCCKQ